MIISRRFSFFFCEEEDGFIKASILQKSPENKKKYTEVLLSSDFAGVQNEKVARRCRCSSTCLGWTKPAP
jgi:hypothetical protein